MAAKNWICKLCNHPGKDHIGWGAPYLCTRPDCDCEIDGVDQLEDVKS